MPALHDWSSLAAYGGPVPTVEAAYSRRCATRVIRRATTCW